MVFLRLGGGRPDEIGHLWLASLNFLRGQPIQLMGEDEPLIRFMNAVVGCEGRHILGWFVPWTSDTDGVRKIPATLDRQLLKDCSDASA